MPSSLDLDVPRMAQAIADLWLFPGGSHEWRRGEIEWRLRALCAEAHAAGFDAARDKIAELVDALEPDDDS